MAKVEFSNEEKESIIQGIENAIDNGLSISREDIKLYNLFIDERSTRELAANAIKHCLNEDSEGFENKWLDPNEYFKQNFNITRERAEELCGCKFLREEENEDEGR